MNEVNQVLQKTKQILAQAQKMYGLDMAHVGIRFDLRGRAAGQACRRGGIYYVRFNRDMLTREAFNHIYNDTIPHEIAHIVCFMNPGLGHNHDAGWARVCCQLGGSGKRCHDEEVVFGKGRTYEYITDRGHAVRVNDRHHAIVQGGRVLVYKRNIGKITKESQCSLVGVSGQSVVPRTLATTSELVQAAATPVQEQHVHLAPKVTTFAAGTSKASVSRSIMLTGYQRGQPYEQIIALMMLECGYNRQLARATYKANYTKVGCPAP